MRRRRVACQRLANFSAAAKPTEIPVKTAAHLLSEAARLKARKNGSLGMLGPICIGESAGTSTEADQNHRAAAMIPAIMEAVLQNRTALIIPKTMAETPVQ